MKRCNSQKKHPAWKTTERFFSFPPFFAKREKTTGGWEDPLRRRPLLPFIGRTLRVGREQKAANRRGLMKRSDQLKDGQIEGRQRGKRRVEERGISPSRRRPLLPINGRTLRVAATFGSPRIRPRASLCIAATQRCRRFIAATQQFINSAALNAAMPH